MPQDIKDNISATLNMTECIRMGKHLGVLSMIGRKKKVLFGYFKDKTWKKIQGLT